MLRLLLVSALVAAAGFAVGAPAAGAQDLDCDDFNTQADAIVALAGGDPHNLDSDNDGYPCEERFGEGAPASADADTDVAVPVGGVATGFGGLASDVSTPWGTTVVSVGLVALGAAAVTRHKMMRA